MGISESYCERNLAESPAPLLCALLGIDFLDTAAAYEE
jgi:hypothetical protein